MYIVNNTYVFASFLFFTLFSYGWHFKLTVSHPFLLRFPFFLHLLYALCIAKKQHYMSYVITCRSTIYTPACLFSCVREPPRTLFFPLFCWSWCFEEVERRKGKYLYTVHCIYIWDGQKEGKVQQPFLRVYEYKLHLFVYFCSP